MTDTVRVALALGFFTITSTTIAILNTIWSRRQAHIEQGAVEAQDSGFWTPYGNLMYSPLKWRGFRARFKHLGGLQVAIMSTILVAGLVATGVTIAPVFASTESASTDLQIAVEPQYQHQASGGYYIPGMSPSDFDDLPTDLLDFPAWEAWEELHQPVKNVTMLSIVFSSPSSEPVVIHDVNITVVNRQEPTGEMIGSGMGDPNAETVHQIVAELGSDPVNLVTEEIPGLAEWEAGGSMEIRRTPFNPPYHVTNEKLMVFHLMVDAQGYDCEWYAEIRYSVGDGFRTARLPKDPSQTYRSVG